MKLVMQLAVSLLMIVSLPALAQGDAEAGKAKSAVCAACHGPDGNSVVPNWPKIAGQHAPYLARQVTLIKSGERPVPEMAGIAMGLSEQDIEDLAAYYASQTGSAGVADETLVAAGKQLYRGGNAATDIPSCMSCHGPAGEGNPLSAYPALAGQHATYTEKMLNGFRSGQTWGAEDASSKIMTGVANRLTDAEIKAVASYIQGLHSGE